MIDDAPRTCAAREKSIPRARFTLTLSLTLAGLALLPSAGGVAGPGDPSEVARAGSSRVDPRGPGVALLGAEPAPDGRWVALRAVRQRPYELALWFVDLSSGEFQPFEQAEPTTAPMVWNGGRLWTEVRRSGRRQLVSIEPQSGDFEPLEHGVALEPDWAGTAIARRAGGLRVLSLSWIGREAVFELPGGPSTEYRLTRAPGLVFYSEPDHGALRVLRHDMRSGTTVEVASIGGLAPRWVPSPDGELVAITDDYRTRLVRAADGEAVSGPWPAGRATWLGRDGHGHVMLVSGGHRQVLDVYAERRVHLGPDEGPEPEVRPLAEGGFLVLCAGRLDHLDRDGALRANLVPGRPRVETARR